MEEARSVVQEFGGSNDTKAADHAKSFLRVARVQTRCNLGSRLESCAGWNYRSVSPDRSGRSLTIWVVWFNCGVLNHDGGSSKVNDETGNPTNGRGNRHVFQYVEGIDFRPRRRNPCPARRAVRSAGFEVHKCMSIESAMRCIEREEFDIAVVDQGSPAFEGRRVIGTWSVTTRLCRSSCGRGHGQGFGTGQTVVIDGGTVLV
jgi:hypothetical protein